MKFYRHDTPTIMDGMVVRYCIDGWDGQITASRNGVSSQGTFPMLTTIDDILACQMVLRRAYDQFLVLVKNQGAFGRVDPLPFDNEPEYVVEQRRYRFASMNREYDVIATREVATVIAGDK